MQNNQKSTNPNYIRQLAVSGGQAVGGVVGRVMATSAAAITTSIVVTTNTQRADENHQTTTGGHLSSVATGIIVWNSHLGEESGAMSGGVLAGATVDLTSNLLAWSFDGVKHITFKAATYISSKSQETLKTVGESAKVNAQTATSNAIDYANTAVENTRAVVSRSILALKNR